MLFFNQIVIYASCSTWYYHRESGRMKIKALNINNGSYDWLFAVKKKVQEEDFSNNDVGNE